MSSKDPYKAIARLVREDSRYKFDAYVFIFESLRIAQKLVQQDAEDPAEENPFAEEEQPQVEHHVSGQQLCEAVRLHALAQYGMLAKCVLNSWGIHTTGDIGEIVFNLIHIEQMRKTPEDRREDFDDVFDFDTALVSQYRITMPES